MQFQVTNKQEGHQQEVDAESWFAALRQVLQEKGADLRLNQLTFTLKEDGVSAQVTDPESGNSWEINAILEPTGDMAYFVSQMKQSWFLLKPYGWLFVLLFLLLGIPTTLVLNYLQFPTQASWLFGLSFGLQGSLWVWTGLACKVGVTEEVEQMHWQSDKAVKRSAVALLVASLTGASAFAIGLKDNPSIWWQTGLWLSCLVSGAYALYNLSTLGLVHAEFQGLVSPGRASRWLSRVMTILVMFCSFVLIGVFDFVVGMHWWHANYVTAERVKEVEKRADALRALQIKTLHDRRGVYLGLYARSESDWSRYYNQTNLMDWKVSRAIQEAEGTVPSATWWWRYLPDGHKLQSEPFSVKAFLRVPYYFLRQRRKVGGSTPALQAAKNFMDFGMKRRNKGLLATIGIKLFVEIPRAYVMAQRFTPREMMATYMATIWAGRGGNYGLHRMSLYYFDQPNPSKLNWNQAAVLAASLPNPGRFNPWYLQSCRIRHCATQRHQAVFDVWKERISQIKQTLRRNGHPIPKEFPPFKNGLHRLRTLSHRWLKHDAHIRSWVRRELQNIPNWQHSSSIRLGYDRRLTLQFTAPDPKQKTNKSKHKQKKHPSKQPVQPKKRGLVGWVQTKRKEFRQKIKDLQIAYTLVDADTGSIVSQYGGDQHVDMAQAKKPVVGSTFKVLTMFIGKYWPDRLPLLNQGSDPKKRHRKLFVYQPQNGTKGFYVRNSHGMPKFVSKRSALVMSANIGFVFFSLRWTWLLPKHVSKQVMRIGLTQMYQERMKLSPSEAKKRAIEAMDDRKRLISDLRNHLGYRSYLHKWQTRSLFEAGKGMAIQELITKRGVSPRTLTLFLDADSLKGFGGYIQNKWAHYRYKMAKEWKEKQDWEWVSWIRPLRMELGLRYIIHLGKQTAGYNERRDNLRPVLTMTLGVNNADTRQLASIAATVAARRVVHPQIVRVIKRGKQIKYAASLPKQGLGLPSGTFDSIQKAMNGVLRWGTATRAGRLIHKTHGIQWLKRSGAKTGTVQRSKGVSCVGYMGQYAGALTISTPRNRPLVKYTLHPSLTIREKALQAKADAYLRCFEKATKESRKAKWCERKWRVWQQRVLRQKRLIASYKAKAKTYLSMGRIWKRSERKAGKFQRLADVLSARMARKHRQIGIYKKYISGEQRMIRLYEKWFARFDKKMKQSLEKATKGKQKADKEYQALNDALTKARAKIEQTKQALKAHKPIRRKGKKNRIKWRALVRQYQRDRYSIKRKRYRIKIMKVRSKHATKRKGRYEHLLKHKTNTYRRNQKRMRNNQQRMKKWQTLIGQTEKDVQRLINERTQALQKRDQWQKQAKQEEARYIRLENDVKRTHTKWGLYSSDACWMLFSLFSQWKQYDQQTTKQAAARHNTGNNIPTAKASLKRERPTKPMPVLERIARVP